MRDDRKGLLEDDDAEESTAKGNPWRWLGRQSGWSRESGGAQRRGPAVNRLLDTLDAAQSLFTGYNAYNPHTGGWNTPNHGGFFGRQTGAPGWTSGWNNQLPPAVSVNGLTRTPPSWMPGMPAALPISPVEANRQRPTPGPVVVNDIGRQSAPPSRRGQIDRFGGQYNRPGFNRGQWLGDTSTFDFAADRANSQRGTFQFHNNLF